MGQKAQSVTTRVSVQLQ